MAKSNKILTERPRVGVDERCPHCNSFNLRMEQTITNGTVQCRKCKVGITTATLQLARKIWNTRVVEKAKMRKLSEVKRGEGMYAKCTRCGEVFIDDLPNYGSIPCPNPECRQFAHCVNRGMSKEQIS